MLQKQTVTGWMIKRIQGTFVAAEFLPLTTVNNTVFKWHRKGHLGGRTPEAGENDEGDVYQPRFREESARTRDYRERVKISTRALHDSIAWIDVAKESIDELVGRGALRLEELRINALIDAANTSAGLKGITWEDLDEGGRNWVGGAGANSILSDIINARTQVWRSSGKPSNTILCSPEVAQAMQDNIETKEWDRKGPFGAGMHAREGDAGTGIRFLEGSEESGRADANIGRLAGHEVFVSSAVVLENNQDEESNLIPLVDKDVFIFRRGEMLGRTAFFETPAMKSKPPNVFARTQEWQYSMALVPLVYRRKLIFTYRNAVV